MSGDKTSIGHIAFIQAAVLIYSFCGVFQKFAAQQAALSFRFFLFYGLVLLSLAVYALGWQQVLKRIPLVTAYASKAVTVVWGLLWGLLFFGETVTLQKAVGVAVIMAGIVLVVWEDGE